MKYIKNKVQKIFTIDKLWGKIAEILDELNGTTNRLTTLEKKSNDIEEELQMLKNCVLDMHSIACYEVKTVAKPQKKDKLLTIEECYEYLEQKIPKAFKIYRELMNNNVDAYIGETLDSCSVEGHKEAENFGKFVRKYLRGYVLDIGCGTQDIPLYLKGYNLDKIYGLDPLPPSRKHPFEYEQGIGEFIPWKDDSFDCVIFATSLDHVILLDKVLDEVKRVLIGGVIW